MQLSSALARGYRGLALLVLNTAVAFVLANLALYFFFGGSTQPTQTALLTAADAPGSEAYERSRREMMGDPRLKELLRFYPGYSQENVAAVLVEGYLRGFVYDPFTQFKERPYFGRFVNVEVHGFRRGSNQGPWPPAGGALNVFVFGGSTTFGYGLPDDQTIPSHLQDLLAKATTREVRVYNFAQGCYFSTQERALFEELILQGSVPDVAVFVDGLNDFRWITGEPAGTERARICFDGGTTARCDPYRTIVQDLPVGRAAAWLRQRLPRLGRTVREAHASREHDPDRSRATTDQQATITNLIARVVTNVKMIQAVARVHGVQAVFVWQPVPTYKYDLRYHPFASHGFGLHELMRLGYPEMANVVASGSLGPNFLWCADFQEEIHKALYIDAVHYTPAMARRVASCIAKGMVHEGLLP